MAIDNTEMAIDNTEMAIDNTEMAIDNTDRKDNSSFHTVAILCTFSKQQIIFYVHHLPVS